MALDDRKFVASANGKWTAGQQLEHVLRSVRPLAKTLADIEILQSLEKDNPDRSPDNYEKIVDEYVSRLRDGAKASRPFIPGNVKIKDRAHLIKSVKQEVTSFGNSLKIYTENQLDAYLLPHPLLGKLTIREMLYFTLYHVEHHHRLTK